MALPLNITTITVTGQYIDFTGNPIAGQVKFYTSQMLIDAAADRIIVPSTITANLDATGAFSVIIPTTNDVDVSPLNFTYTYEEAFIGGSTYTILLPASLGASVDISDLRTTATVLNYAQPVSYNLWPGLVARVVQEEEDLDDSPKLLAENTYTNLALYSDTYSSLASAFPTYGAVVPATELNFTAARIREIIDRIADLYDYTASSLELRDTTNSGTVSGTTYAHLTAKRGTYAGLSSAYATYGASTGASQSWTYAQVGALITDLGKALAGQSGITDAWLSLTRSVVDGTYGGLGLQSLTYGTLASTYATYGSVTGTTFTFIYPDTADTIRNEANRPNRLMLMGVQ